MNTIGKLLRSQLGLALIAGVVVGTAGTLTFLHSGKPALAEPGETGVLSGPELSALQSLDTAGTKLVEAVAPSVVLIKTNRGEGSGVIYRSDGYIVTNAHVVGTSKKVSVEFHDGHVEDGNVVVDSDDSFNDIAIVKVDKTNLAAAHFADSGSARPGQLAVAIGAPFGLAESVSFGHVSALGRQNFIPDRESSMGVRGYFSMIQTDAAINPGNSGGPLLNYRGEVIGINTAINSTTGYSSGVGFAIPSNTAKIIADQLISKGQIIRAYMGVEPSDMKGFESEKLGIKQGAILRKVEDNAPGAKGGLKAGDVVIEIAGKPIRGEQDLRDAMLLTAPDQAISIKAIRNGNTQSFQVKPTNRPADPVANRVAPQENGDEGSPFDFGPDMPRIQPPSTGNKAPDMTGPVRLGVQARDLTAAEKSRSPVGIGAMVDSVDPSSVAASAGIKAGMVITQLGDTKITSASDLKAAIAKFKHGDRTIVTYGKVDGSGSMTMSVTITL